MWERGNLTLRDLKELTQSMPYQGYPKIRFILKANLGIRSFRGKLGVFSASFNPPTIAHVEMVRKAQEIFHLDEVLLLVSPRNADKISYEATLEERLWMLLQMCKGEKVVESKQKIESKQPAACCLLPVDKISLGVCSHPYFTDMTQAIRACYPQETEIYFVVGYDTFERILDKEGKYYPHYYKAYKTREESLEDLFTTAHFIVIGRGKHGLDALNQLLKDESNLGGLAKIHYLELPEPYPQISATEVRKQIKQGLSVEDLVPPEVLHYLEETGLYKE